MTNREQKIAAKSFAERWKNRGDEKSDTQKFWLDLLQNVFDVHINDYIEFEKRVHLEHKSFIDVYIKDTKILIEQKSLSVDLRKTHKQSDGTELNAYGQAKRYADWLGLKEKPRYIITCNFRSFLIYDQEHPRNEPEEIFLENLPKEYYRLSILASHENPHLKREMELSMEAGEIVGELYNAFIKQYHNPESENSLKSLNMLCVRIVFCLYAEDAEIFGLKNQFHNYLAQFEPKYLRDGIIKLFRVLNTKLEDRDPYLEDELTTFPYVNGGLFEDESIEIPQFNDDIKKLLLAKASDDFDWSDISPTIFGALFESTLNPVTRRTGGMHYTSIENIHKVIDPLFLNSLKEELKEILESNQVNVRKKALGEFQDKLASLTFLDPACGSGNFLTETYLSLRKLENEVLLKFLEDGQRLLNLDGTIKISIKQFYGIEINDFAVTVAKTALWIAESQMMKQTETIIHADLDFLPLKSYSNIIEANALQIDWQSVIPKENLNYIMGNPPFVGHQWRSKEQANDMSCVFNDFDNYGKLDYVASWFKIASDFISCSNIKAAFVATNSLVQGESVAIMWKPFFEIKMMEIDFAWQTFRWNSEAMDKAHVHCVIIGFSYVSQNKNKRIFSVDGSCFKCQNINGYLADAPNVFIQNRSKVLTKGLLKMTKGSQPTDGGNLIFSVAERNKMLTQYPSADNLLKKYVSGDDYINDKVRYCLWLKDVSPNLYRNIPEIMVRLQKVADMRRSSPTKSVQRDAETPMLFTQIRQPVSDYLLVPRVSSERRKYIPIGFMSNEIICSDANLMIPNATLYHFGILTSTVHNAWMRVVCGRLKSDYRYSPAVYNNFPWPDLTTRDEEKIASTAQDILDIRSQYSDCSLADLYNDLTMPPALRKAHKANDDAVMKAYGFKSTMTEPEIVAELMKMYQNLIKS